MTRKADSFDFTAETMPTDRAEQHAYTDRRGRNLCDRCDQWQGSPLHIATDPIAPLPDEDLVAIEKAHRSYNNLGVCEADRHLWPCHTARAFAALRAERAAPLDVERLASALAVMGDGDGVGYEGTRRREYAVNLAAEYARLARATGEGGE